MKNGIILICVLLFILSCTGVQQVREEIKIAPNYSGKWSGQSMIEVQGFIDNIELTLVHEGNIITGILNDTAGYLSNVQLTDVDLKEKTLTFLFIASTPMGNIPVNSTGTFSEDEKELSITFMIPNLNMSGNAKLIRSGD
jgi:hypothetical protein